MKKLFCLFLGFFILLSLAIVPAMRAEAKEIKAALIMPGIHTDFGWNYVGFQALSNLKKAIPQVKRIGYTELVGPPDLEKVLRDYQISGYNLVFVLGYQFKEGVDRVLKDKPKNFHVAIIEGSPADLIKDFCTYLAPMGNTASYVLGVLAGGMTKTNKVGVLSGMESVDVLRNIAGYIPGVKSINPGAKVVHTVIGRWDDAPGGKQAANAMINSGIDVIYCMGDGTSIGVMEAVKEARGKGKRVFYIGYPANQYETASNIVLSSIIYDWTEVFQKVAQDALNGSFGRHGYDITLGSGIDIAPFYQFEEEVPQKVKDAMSVARQKIESGDLKVPLK